MGGSWELTKGDSCTFILRGLKWAVPEFKFWSHVCFTKLFSNSGIWQEWNMRKTLDGCVSTESLLASLKASHPVGVHWKFCFNIRPQYGLIFYLQRKYVLLLHEHDLPKAKLFFFFFRVAYKAHGGSQARGQIGATAAGLHHSHSDARSELCLRPTPQLMATTLAKRGQWLNLHPHRC